MTSASLLAGILFFTGCSTTRSVPEKDYLYTGTKIKPTVKKFSKEISGQLEDAIRPKPNKSLFLGIQLKLMIYNSIADTPKPKGLMAKIKYKWGEAPVLASQYSIPRNRSRMESILFTKGYLQPEIKGELKPESKKKARVEFELSPGTRYRVRDVHYPEDTSILFRMIGQSAATSLIRKDDFFDTEMMEAERKRIDGILKEQGFFYFNPEYLLFKADSLHQGFIDLYITLKEETPEMAKEQWWIGDVSIYSNYSLRRDSVLNQQEGKRMKQFTVIDKQNKYRPEVFERTVRLREGELYQKSRQQLTIERLMNLQTFRFARTLFIPDSTDSVNKLNTRIYLTPGKKRSLRLELSGESKSNNYLGSNVSLIYRNINLFKGAEILDIKLSGGFDFQVGGQQVNKNAYSLNGEASLTIPKILPNFIRFRTRHNSYLPRTRFDFGVEYVRRQEQYTIKSFKFGAGYNWKYGKTTEHHLKIIDINSFDTLNITPYFDSILHGDPTLQASFQEQLVLGSRYHYTFNNTYRTNRNFNYILEGDIKPSGNLFSLLAPKPADSPYVKNLFTVPVAQFIRLEANLRGFLKLNSKLTWANRVIMGVIFSYGNSKFAPYSEQFFIGGSSSVRAFRARTLGPGSYHSTESVYAANESGEIKFEWNTEMRWDVYKWIKMAAFIDGGNIWYRHEDYTKIGSGYDPKDLFREMAVGLGLGLRLDFSVLVLRFDLAMPVRKPWYQPGNRWVFNEIDFGSKEWRQENLVLNIGIGYPF